jgi:uncharacterized protein YciW
MPAALTDVMDALAGIKPGSALDAVRNRRPQAREQAEASFRALFEPESFAGVSATERFALAVFVTGLHGDAVSAAFYIPINNRRGQSRSNGSSRTVLRDLTKCGPALSSTPLRGAVAVSQLTYASP